MNLRQLGMLILLTLVLVAPMAFAATGGPFEGGRGGGGDFVPIVAIPQPGGGTQLATSGCLGDYINALFKLSLAAGATLAAIYIAIGGFEYIFAEAMESKKDGKLRIMHALYGLAILLAVTMILFIIGGQNAINLNIFSGGCLG